MTLNSFSASSLPPPLEVIVPFPFFVLPSRAEPLLARIKADRTVVVSPVFDKVHFDDLHVERYIPASHAFDWALWCMYESFSPQWEKMADESQPGKYVEQAVFYLAI